MPPNHYVTHSTLLLCQIKIKTKVKSLIQSRALRFQEVAWKPLCNLWHYKDALGFKRLAPYYYMTYGTLLLISNINPKSHSPLFLHTIICLYVSYKPWENRNKISKCTWSFLWKTPKDPILKPKLVDSILGISLQNLMSNSWFP